ncbi:chromosome segregation protein SMC [Lactobacillus helveticus]|uniref:Chromosome partition protein Smc n=3 Tax=Lactobacillus helveticus TaxID=1587 RepID=A0A2V4FEE3_LACHE|nr:chromosome segregation protein SMC [Lactobacillus helveticus]AZA19713.1 MAG: chromosome segregation protein SMC [Lactobacillus helveticus]EEW68860.1 chromosome segregation protein SMC [Lactobacillus helveticus DSM 20075 = CGMCC 1.1877]KGL03780.1 chromosome segregation protein SMC [Lactobacillus helveticus]KGL05444.1 chromosome segregation protein SMC [Lactobacillus helveticus]KRL39729.1 cell division protein Smc [Lactobacillus helveticus DSM 20075 = CGMCC 1.1877]
MPLTELVLDGFKSFADRTTIHFNDGITGIVGPNGSGKSNITEAIRWVMGEASAKSLRGMNMKDVIFAGSQYRKPLNKAEVTLIFDNQKRELAFDADEVSITRKILRSGDSEFLINGQQVRMRDVRTLFLDSGISQNSLAIISQGRVDQILNSRPEQRRVIFEEAAGVLHFKQQKEAAQGQLKKTQDNLIRINDLVKELEGRLEPLHEQSSLAKEYKFQKAGLDKELKSLLAFEIEDINKQKEDVQKSADKNKILLSKLDAEVKESQDAVSKKRAEYQEIRDEREKVQNELLKLGQQLSDLNANLQMAEQSRQFDDATKIEYQNQVETLKKSLVELNAQLDNLQKDQASLKKQQAVLQKKRDKLTGELSENPEELNKKLEDCRNDYIQLLQDQAAVNNQVINLNTELKRSKADTTYQSNDVAKQLTEAKAELEKLRTEGKNLTAKRKDKNTAFAEINDQSKELNEQIRRLQETVNDERNKLEKIEARHEALINIQKRHEGYYYGVRNVLNHLSDFPGVIGVVGELLTFPAELEAAMTTALGGGVQDLITDSRNSAKNAINQLKRSRAGRATFLPLDGLRQYTIPQSTVTILKSFNGFKGIASDLVESKTDHNITAAINYLLGSVVIVDSIENAMAISQRIGRYRIVTLDGDVVSPGGSMTGGQKNLRNNSPLQTATEINQLEQQIKSLTSSFKEDQAQLKALVDQSVEVDKKLQELHDSLQEINQTINETAISFQNQEKEVKRLQDANTLYESRVKERNDHIVELQKQIADANDKQTLLSKQGKEKKSRMNELQSRIKNFNNLSQRVQSELSKLDPQIAVFANKLENLAVQEKDMRNQIDNNQKQAADLKEKLASLNQNGELSAKKNADLKNQKTEIKQKHEELQNRLNELSSQLGQLDAQINQLDQVASRNYDLRKDAAIEQEDYSVKIAKFNSLIDQRLETLRDDYALTFEAAIAQAEGKNDQETRDKLAKSVKLHRMSIEDIGPVNLDSIQEYEDVKKRYDFLNGQQNDLLKARDDLEKSMNELDEEVNSRFKATFEAVAESFKKIFPLVFGGGKAKLELTEPNNLLETGIEIIAQPPGKKLQRLSLLSGGERALTAITLLFAMLQVNPVPFCLLDEVEAALDDANVTRFAQFLLKYDLKTQFIVITHRRGTMKQADQLYGVVMQESGVSQVLSVSLKEMKNKNGVK